MKNFILALLCLMLSMSAQAELRMFKQSIVSDSEEPFDRRIYSYDFDISADGIIHAIYSKPVVGEDRAQIIYMTKAVGAEWPAEDKRIVLEEFGSVLSISTWLIYDNASKKVHISYIVKRPFIDHGTTHTYGLVYQSIVNNKVGAQINVSSGGFHTRMQLDNKNLPVFAREYEVFLNADGTLRTPPFPKALRLQIANGNNSWTDKEYILKLPAEEDYRLGNFVYDAVRGRVHLTYGNKNAVELRNTYPTTNPPLTIASKPVYFPPGVGHQLRYAYSDDLKSWQVSTIDSSGNISENEFWTDLVLNAQGIPYAMSFRYKTDQQGVQEGSTGIFGGFANNSWSIATIAGKTSGASEPRAGAAAKIAIDSFGGFHGVWDNSPDAPIDSEAKKGTTMYHYSPDGIDWETRQMILPFSVEGACRMKLFNNKMFLMALGDATDARLVFSEFQMPGTNANLMEVSTDKMFYGLGENIKFHVRMQGNGQQNANLYFAAVGPYNVNSKGELELISTTEVNYLGSDFEWHKITNLSDAKPAVFNYPLKNYSGFFMQELAGISPPFNNSARYRLYSIATDTKPTLVDANALTPLYFNDIHLCSAANCAEIKK